MWSRREHSGLRWHERGAGAPVVLLHGLPSPASDLMRLGDALEGSWRMIVPDLPGYDGAPAGAGRHGATAIEDALVAVMLAEGAGGAALVGYSMGGYRALSLALRAELQPAAVVTLGGFAALTDDERAGMTGFAAALRAGQDLRPVAGPRFLSSGFRARSPDRIAEIEAWLALAPAAVMIEELEDLALAPSLLPRLSALQRPVLAITGAEDVAMPPRHAEQIGRAAPKGRFEMIPGVGHALLTEALEATAPLVSQGLMA
jgi:3-oxoadipate enol-lactonase